MVEHDGQVGQVLAKLKELGLDENTIVMYSTDNGAETFTWPDGGTTMFRGEKNTQWEGGYRVPTMIKWPGVIKPGTVINDIGAHEDMLTTFLAAAGDKTVTDDLLKGRKIGEHELQGPSRRLRPRPGAAGRGRLAAQGVHLLDRRRQRRRAALRQLEDHVPRAGGRRPRRCGRSRSSQLRAPKLTNLRMDPFERAEEENAMGYQRWYMERMFMIAPAGALRRPVAAELQGVPAAAEAGQLQPRPRDGSGDERSAIEVVMA